MSNPTDILGKVGQKVGQEIKDIRDNYATKVSLANIGSSIDFSDYATVVSLGSVKSELKASLASYTSGGSVFTKLKAQRAEVDELVVKGDTTIVNTQTVEVSDNVIEVNLAADDNITADTGGLAVNRGLIAESSTIDTSLISAFTPVQGTLSTEGGIENVINEAVIELNKEGAMALPLKDLLDGPLHVKFIKSEDATNPSVDYINGQHFWLSGASVKYYEGVIDFGFHATASATPYRMVPEFVVAKSTGATKPVFKHGIEDLGNGNQDVWRRIDSMANYGESKLYFDSTSNNWIMVTSRVDGGMTNSQNNIFYSLVEPVPYEEWDRSKVKYIDVFGNSNLTPFSETTAKDAGAELGPDLVKYILRDDNPNMHLGGNTLGTYDVAQTGPATKVNGSEVNLPEYIQYSTTGQSIGLDSQLENTYSVRAYFTEDNKVMAKATEYDSDGNITVLDSTETQIGTWSHDGTDTTIAASAGYTVVLVQWLDIIAPGALSLRINNTEAITSQDAGTYQTPSTEVSEGTLQDWKLGAHHFLHNNSTEFPFLGTVTSYSNSWSQSGYQIELPDHMGINYEFTVSFISGEVQLRVKDKGTFQQQIHTIGTFSGNVATMNAGWTLTPNRPGGTNTESINLEWTGEKPAENTTVTPGVSYIPDEIAYATAKNQYGDVLYTGYAFRMFLYGNSLRVFNAGFGPIIDPVVGSDGFTRTRLGAQVSPGGTFNDVVTWQEAGVNGDAELLWDEPKGAWTLNKDGGAAKLYYGNIFPTASDLPSASTYHGMFAHVHDTGRGYFAHNGAWQELLDLAANQTVNGNLEFSAGNALKVADSSGIKINNIDLGNYASFESALTNLLNPPAPSAVSAVGTGVSASTVEFPTTQNGAVVFADTVTYTKNGVKHVYKKTGSDYATVVLNGTNRYFYVNYLLDTGESDAGATDTYGKFGTISHDGRNIPRYFYVSDNGLISTAYLGGSGSGDLSSYGPSVLTIDPFVILFPDEVSPLA